MMWKFFFQPLLMKLNSLVSHHIYIYEMNWKLKCEKSRLLNRLKAFSLQIYYYDMYVQNWPTATPTTWCWLDFFYKFQHSLADQFASLDLRYLWNYLICLILMLNRNLNVSVDKSRLKEFLFHFPLMLAYVSCVHFYWDWIFFFAQINTFSSLSLEVICCDF